MAEWISVEERPPKWPCVVYDGHNRPYTPRGCIAMFEDKDGNREWIPDHPLDALLQGKRAEMHNLPVTHWMPLPEPPKED